MTGICCLQCLTTGDAVPALSVFEGMAFCRPHLVESIKASNARKAKMAAKLEDLGEQQERLGRLLDGNG